MISVSVNGDLADLDDGTTVAVLVERLDQPAKGVAVAVNEEVVPRSTWSSRPLRSGDRVEVLRAAQGGC